MSKPFLKMRLDYVYLVLATHAFISCDCLLAGFKALTGDSPVVALEGTAVLRCHTSIPIELTEVRLFRTVTGNNSTINIFKDGKDQLRCDLPEYTGRTEVMRDGLAHGRVTFKLFNVSVADEGAYFCYLGTHTHFDIGELKLNVTADFRALTQESPLIMAVGDTAVLRCRTSVPVELNEVRWIRIEGGRYSIINLFKEGKDQQSCDLPEYIGRTELMKEGLAHGGVALKVFNVFVADEGTYRCYLGTDDHFGYFDFGDLELRVTALGSHPRIDIGRFQDGGIKAVCRSAGWYPEPTLVNKDDGELMIQKEENGLYSIEYSRVLTENSNRTFSCMLRTSFPYQERESSIYVADELFRKDVCIVISTILLVLLAAAAGTALYLWTHQRNKQGTSSTVPTGPLYLKVPMKQVSNDVCTDPV